MSIEVFVHGRPAPQGSKRHVGHGRLIESSPHLALWRRRVALVCQESTDGLTPPPVGVSLRFVLPRPQRTAQGASPPAVKRPDVDKLARAVLDALTGVYFRDDSEVTDLHATKRIAEPGEPTGVHIEVRTT